jgi:hypothetical protein
MAMDISGRDGDPNDYLALPVSIVFMGEETQDDPCGGADLDGGGTVDFRDLAILASQWMGIPKVPSADLAPNPVRDQHVDIQDLAVLARYWLQTGCR